MRAGPLSLSIVALALGIGGVALVALLRGPGPDVGAAAVAAPPGAGDPKPPAASPRAADPADDPRPAAALRAEVDRSRRDDPAKIDPETDPAIEPAPETTPRIPPPRAFEPREANDVLHREVIRLYQRREFAAAQAEAEAALADAPRDRRMLRIAATSACIRGERADAMVHYGRMEPADRRSIRERCRRHGIALGP